MAAALDRAQGQVDGGELDSHLLGRSVWAARDHTQSPDGSGGRLEAMQHYVIIGAFDTLAALPSLAAVEWRTIASDTGP